MIIRSWEVRFEDTLDEVYRLACRVTTEIPGEPGVRIWPTTDGMTWPRMGT